MIILRISQNSGKLCFPVEPKHNLSWYKLKRVLVWINRFIQNSQRSKKIERTCGVLLADELKTAEIQLVRYAQLTGTNKHSCLAGVHCLPTANNLGYSQGKTMMDALRTQIFFRTTSGILSFYPDGVGQ